MIQVKYSNFWLLQFAVQKQFVSSESWLKHILFALLSQYVNTCIATDKESYAHAYIRCVVTLIAAIKCNYYSQLLENFDTLKSKLSPSLYLLFVANLQDMQAVRKLKILYIIILYKSGVFIYY